MPFSDSSNFGRAIWAMTYHLWSTMMTYRTWRPVRHRVLESRELRLLIPAWTNANLSWISLQGPSPMAWMPAGITTNLAVLRSRALSSLRLGLRIFHLLSNLMILSEWRVWMMILSSDFYLLPRYHLYNSEWVRSFWNYETQIIKQDEQFECF